MDGCLTPWMQINAQMAKLLDQLVTGQWAMLGKNATDRPHAATLDVIREPQLGVPRLVAGSKYRAEQFHQPVDIIRRNEMERPSHQPGTDD